MTTATKDGESSSSDGPLPCAETLMNLSLLDPSRFGWTAIGGVADLLTPHERSQRRSTCVAYRKNQRRRQQQLLLRQRQQGGINNSIDSDIRAMSSISSSVPSVPQQQQQQQQQDQPAEAATAQESQTPGVAASTALPQNGVNSLLLSGCSGGEKSVQNKEDPNKCWGMSIQNTPPITTDNNNATTTTTAAVIESTVTAIQDGVLDMYSYHRGREGMEPRDEDTGELLCVPIPTDTNHNNDAPKLVLNMIVEFPLEDSIETTDTTTTKDNTTTTTTTMNNYKNAVGSKEKAAAAAVYRESMQWDLGNPSTPSPLTFATNIADEYGLSFGQMVDLSVSLQEQIDAHLQQHFHYSTPLALRDPQHNERRFTGPTRRTYRFDQVVRTREGGVPQPKTERSKHRSLVSSSYSRQSSRSSTGGGSTTARSGSDGRRGRGRSTVRTYQEISFGEEEPIEEEYCDEVRKRGKEASARDVTEKAMGGTVGALATKKEFHCHICHKRATIAYGFACRKESHYYCAMHCKTRLNLDVSASPIILEFCPICSLNCQCSACGRKAGNVARALKKACEEQNKSASEAVFDDILDRCLTASARCGVIRKKIRISTDEEESTLPTSTAKSTEKVARPPRLSTDSAQEREKRAKKRPIVPKPPFVDFPREVNGFVELDPGTPDDYMKVYTAYGTFPVDNIPEAWTVGSDDDSPANNEDVVVEDGNVDYCHSCQKAGNLVCCDYCPRAFHSKCLEEDPANDGEDLWKCSVCEKEIAGFEDDKIDGTESLDRILYTFADADITSPKKQKCMRVLAIVHEMLQKLIDYDFGFMFQAPVQNVEGYSDIVKHPMDLGTIGSKLVNGGYATIFKETNSIDKVVIAVLQDIELVWHNCFLFNSVDSSIYRMANVHRRRVQSIRRQSYDHLLSEKVKATVAEYIDSCEKERGTSSQADPSSNLGAKEKLLRSIRPKGKYKIGARAAYNAAAKVIAVLDPASGRVLKLYSSMKAAVTAGQFLSNLGHQSEWTNLDVKSIIQQSASDPSALLFGYRWLLLEDLRSNRVKFLKPSSNAIEMKHNDETHVYLSTDEAVSYSGMPKTVEIDSLRRIINGIPVGPEWVELHGISWRRPLVANVEKTNGQRPSTKHRSSSKVDKGELHLLRGSVALKEDLLTSRKLVGFGTISAAYNDWVQTTASSPTFPESESKTMDVFKKYYLDGDRNVDGIVWRTVEMASGEDGRTGICKGTLVNGNKNPSFSVMDNSNNLLGMESNGRSGANSVVLSESNLNNSQVERSAMEVDSYSPDEHSMLGSGNKPVNQNHPLVEDKNRWSMACGGETVKALQPPPQLAERHHGDPIRLNL